MIHGLPRVCEGAVIALGLAKPSTKGSLQQPVELKGA